METIGLLLLKANLAIIVFTLFYWFLLRKLTFYHINRVYLLFAVLFTLLFPFIDISFFSPEQLAVIPDLVPAVFVEAPGGDHAGWYYFTTAIWITGLSICALRLCFQFYSLYILHRRSVAVQDNKHIRIVSDPISPFSFGPYIYINPNIHNQEQLHIVLLHEQVHVKHKHTFDILLTEILLIINWFNPLAWLLRKAVKENLEYVTDNQVLKNGVQAKEYQYHLLNTTCFTPAFTVQNSFNIADLKKRIIQMNAEKTAGNRLLSYSFIPVLSGLLLLLNKPVQDFAQEVLGIAPETVVMQQETTNNDTGNTTSISNPAVIKKNSTDKKKKTLQPAGETGLTQLADIHASSTTALTATIKNTPAPVTPRLTEIIVTGYPSAKKQVNGTYQGVPIPAAEKAQPTNNQVKVVQGFRVPEQ